MQEDSILHGCIPVIIQDNIDVPLETLLNISLFSIRYPRDKLGQLVDFLKAIPLEQVAIMKQRIFDVWPRFYYTSYIKREVFVTLHPLTRAKLLEIPSGSLLCTSSVGRLAGPYVSHVDP